LQNILQHYKKKDLDEIKKSLIYPLYQKYENPYDAFQNLSLKDEDIYEGLENTDVNPELKKELIAIVKKRMATHPVKVGADIQVSCYSEGGIDEIKKALKAGLEVGKPDVSIQLVSSPTYSIWMITIDEKRGKQIIEKVISVVRESITTSGGSLTVFKEPSLIGKNENKFAEEEDE